ncbi:hypothetical protein BD769DRAFT_1024298 [Suillus cothurnatus]|nr:hypothetical protein BD769DRAFT_1024298 [Suillus cothurnatus]
MVLFNSATSQTSICTNRLITMGGCMSVFQRPQRQTHITENGNGNSVDNIAASTDSTTPPLMTPVVSVPVSSITTQPDALVQRSAPQAQVQFDLPMPSNTVDENFVPSTVTILQPATPGTHEAQPVVFDADLFAIPSTSIKRQSGYPTSSGGLGDIWKCSMIIDPATSTEVAVKNIRIMEISNKEAVQKAKRVC